MQVVEVVEEIPHVATLESHDFVVSVFAEEFDEEAPAGFHQQIGR